MPNLHASDPRTDSMTLDQVRQHVDEDPQSKQMAAQAQLDAVIEPIIGNTINGLVLTIQGLPAEILAKAVARVTGKVIGRIAAQGPLTAVLALRAAAREEFSKGVDSIKPLPPTTPGAPRI